MCSAPQPGSNSFSSKNLSSPKSNEEGREVTSLSGVSLIPVSVGVSGWVCMCVCVLQGQPSLVSPSLIPPLQSKSPATALQSHTHTHAVNTPPIPHTPSSSGVTPSPPPHPQPPSWAAGFLRARWHAHSTLTLFSFLSVSRSYSFWMFCSTSQTAVHRLLRKQSRVNDPKVNFKPWRKRKTARLPFWGGHEKCRKVYFEVTNSSEANFSIWDSSGCALLPLSVIKLLLGSSCLIHLVSLALITSHSFPLSCWLDHMPGLMQEF